MTATTDGLALTTFASLLDTTPHAHDYPRADVELLLTNHLVLDAKGGPGWSPCVYGDGATRGNAGVERMTALVYDVDHGEPAWALLDSYDYLAYTTYSHTVAAPRWRVVLFLTEPIRPADYPEAWQRVRHAVVPNADPSCKDLGRFYYLPTCPPDAPPATRTHAGAPLDWQRFAPVPEAPRPARPARTGPARGDRPGDDYNARGDCREVLRDHGWQFECRRPDGTEYWRRAGKDTGWSATFNYGGSGLFYVWSSNAEPFEAQQSYTPFAVYTVLEHGGDYTAATRALAAQDYGATRQNGTAGDPPPPGAPPPPDGPPAADEAPPADALPQINANELDLRITTAQTWAALQHANTPTPFLFRHANTVKRIEPNDGGRLVLTELTVDRLRHVAARAAEYVVLKRVETQDVEGNLLSSRMSRKVVHPPLAALRDVLATPNVPLPIVSRIVACPTFAADGTLQATEGYHPASGVYCALPAGLVLPPVPAVPSDVDVEAARQLWEEEVLGDFPFVAPADRANALGLALLPIVRDCIPGPTPLHCAESPTPGNGKGLLVDALLRPTCGRNAAIVTQARDDDEWRKRLTAALGEGPPAIVIDNLTRTLDSAALSSALTRTDWTDRILGHTQILSVPIHNIWAATANNIAVSSEIARRTIRIRIDALVEKPHERAGPRAGQPWRHPRLLEWVEAQRGPLLHALLVLAQHWFAAGRPAFTERTALGSYERWTDVVGGILQHAGVPGFLANLDEFYEAADLETAVWRAFVEAWWAKHQGQEVGTGDLFGIALETDGLDLGNGSERAQRTVFGKALGRQRDRVIGGYRVARANAVHRTARWCLLPTNRATGD